MATSDILGSGLAFPPTVDHRGALALVGGRDDIEQALVVILGTAPGERPMRPEFGCEIHDLVFDTIDAET
ncbi:MAG: GPW/gp25 family protein, partial [Solirubrobacteraceae bacterium]